MRAAAERFARRWWTGEFGRTGDALTVLFTPAGWLWRVETARRARRYARTGGVRIPGLAVVSVGNLAVGGTGKTPIASWIARRYVLEGARPALLLSGYGRDEALLHERWTPNVPVLVGRDRVRMAHRARELGVDVAIVDDGFQHRGLGREADVVLLAVEDAFPGRILPCGPYREGMGALERADAVLVTRRGGPVEAARALAAMVDERYPALVKGSVRLTGGGWADLEGKGVTRRLGDVVAAAAVARPGAFRSAVAALVTGSVELVSYRDHHEYTAADANTLRERAGDRPVVVTEKDAVKLIRFRQVLGEVYVLRQELEWDWGEADFTAVLPSVPSVETT